MVYKGILAGIVYKWYTNRNLDKELSLKKFGLVKKWIEEQTVK